MLHQDETVLRKRGGTTSQYINYWAGQIISQRQNCQNSNHAPPNWDLKVRP